MSHRFTTICRLHWKRIQFPLKGFYIYVLLHMHFIYLGIRQNQKKKFMITYVRKYVISNKTTKFLFLFRFFYFLPHFQYSVETFIINCQICKLHYTELSLETFIINTDIILFGFPVLI